ncbi:MAG: hypothetical protein COA70_03645 [Planctomycetota bacterium]|nr:MAG: hypothetical protein COA70_03645 [Planctomycetota bacterium]
MWMDVLLYGALIPGAAAGLIALLGARPVALGQHVSHFGSMALGGGFAAAFALYFGIEGLSSPTSWQWVFWVSVVAMPLGTMTTGRIGRKLGFKGTFLLVAVVCALLLHPMMRKLVPHEIESGAAWTWALGLGVLGAMLASCMEVSARTFTAKKLLPAWLLYASLFAGLVFELGSARLSQMSGFVAAGCGAFLVLAWLLPKRQILPTASFAFVLILLQIAANTYFFGYDVAGLPLLLAGLPPVLLALSTRWKWLRNGKAIPTGIVLACTTVLPLLCAYAVAVMGGEVDAFDGSTLPY